MLQIKKVFLAISLCVLGLITSLVLIYPGIGMPEGEYNEILSGVLVVEACEGQIHEPVTKYIALPHREERFQDGLKCYRFETMLPHFALEENAKLLLNVQGRFHEISINGVVVARVVASDDSRKVARHSPYALLINRTMLRDNENRLMIHFMTYDPVIAVSGMGVGSAAKVDAIYWAYNFISDTFIYAMNFLLLIIGFYLVNFSFAYKDEKLLGLAGRSMLLLAVLCTLNLAQNVPTLIYPLWRALLLGFSVTLTATIIEFMLVYAEKEIKPHEKTLMNIAILGIFFSALIFNDRFSSFASFTVMLLFNIYCLFMILTKQVRQKLFKSYLGIFYLISFIIAYVTFMHDFMLMPGHGELLEWLHETFFLPPLFREEIFVAHAGVIMLFFSMLMIVVERYQSARDYAETEADRIYAALTRNEADLRTMLDQQHLVESTQIIQNERQRLLFEIHTGIGMRLQEGYQRAVEDRLTSAQFVDVFQDCIDDMRLIMDCISMRPHVEIDIIIGAMLHRMQPRMIKSGIEIHIDPHRRSSEAKHLTDVQCLYAGRMMQACLTKALRNKDCTTVTIRSHETSNSLFICCFEKSPILSEQTFQTMSQSNQGEYYNRPAALGLRLRRLNSKNGSGMAMYMRIHSKVVVPMVHAYLPWKTNPQPIS